MLLFLSLLLFQPAQGAQFAAVGLTTNSGVYCTGTVVRSPVTYTCHLLTDAHCTITDSLWKVNGVEDSIVVQKDHARDLAELQLTDATREMCKSISPFKTQGAYELSQSANHLSILRVRNGLTEIRSSLQNLHTVSTRGVTREVYSLGGIDDLVVENIYGDRGFSGGPVFEKDGTLIGIFKRFTANETINVITTTREVQEFLSFPDHEGQPPLIDPKSLSESCPQVPPNRYSNGGGNTQTGGKGGNSQGGGSGNSGETELFTRQWETFREPKEGVLDPTCKKIVLARGNARIDGQEDYERLRSLIHFPWIERPHDNYPDLKIREQILDRFLGEYRNLNLFTMDKHAVGKGRVDHAGFYRLRLSIKKVGADYEIALRNPIYYVMPPDLNTRNLDHSGIAVTYKAKLLDDAKTVELTAKNQRLLCVNDNYLKLICEGSGVQFSLSRPYTRSSDLRLRITTYQPDESPYILHSFGTMIWER